MIRPAAGSGANTAERVPTTSFAVPAWALPPRVEALALRETRVQNGELVRRIAPRSLPTSCGVRPISGTSSSVCRPAASSRAMSRR